MRHSAVANKARGRNASSARRLRSQIMRAVRRENTGPELAVRRLLYAEGFRYRLHRHDLPGTPDIVLPGRRKVIFVNGCFWHGHGCKRIRAVQENADYWTTKIERNKRRDARNARNLRLAGWSVATVWECQLRREPELRNRLVRFLIR